MTAQYHFSALAALLLTCMAASSCSDAECTAGQRKCENNSFYSCYQNEWRIIECKGKAPVCTVSHGCTKSQGSSQDPTPSTSSCSDDEQMCVGNNFYKCNNNKWRIIQCPTEMPLCDPVAGCTTPAEP